VRVQHLRMPLLRSHLAVCVLGDRMVNSQNVQGFPNGMEVQDTVNM
jgi:hypothetical protein